MCLIYARHSSESFKYLYIESVHLHNNTVIIIPLASPVAQLVKNLPAMWDTWVQSLGWEDSLEKGTATHLPGEGNSYPLQYSCLENSMNRGAWQATVHWVAKSNMTEQLSLWPSFLTNKKIRQRKFRKNAQPHTDNLINDITRRQTQEGEP